MLSHLLTLSFALTSVLCHTPLPPSRRALVSPTNPSYIDGDWSYDATENWGAINPSYSLCQTGTQQSPIDLSTASGFSSYHVPTFRNYENNVTGNWTNRGWGPSFDIYDEELTSLPSTTFDNTTAYLVNWHIHAPTEHSVDGRKSRAEMHLVHVDPDSGDPVAVLAIFMDPAIPSSSSSNSSSSPSPSNLNNNTTDNDLPFLSQLPPYVPFPMTQDEEPAIVPNVSMNMQLALDAVDGFREFWTYGGSLTTPPCSEGVRWFVAGTVAGVGTEQMREILGASTFSARGVQGVWRHGINEL